MAITMIFQYADLKRKLFDKKTNPCTTKVYRIRPKKHIQKEKGKMLK